MVTKEKLLYEQAYHALLGGIIGSRFTHPFKEICSTIGLTEKEWNKLKKELDMREDEIEQVEDYLNENKKQNINHAKVEGEKK